jgi:saccharopine dehydrogenase-like NADP-dependent oxidoreductase
MQQTVGFPMAIGSMMILDGKIQKPGMNMPMHIPLDFYFKGLEQLESLSGNSVNPDSYPFPFHLFLHFKNWI